MSDLQELCEKLEHYETDPWAADAILRHEILTPTVIDPCAGTGILTKAARALGYTVLDFDIHDWGYGLTQQCDWLDLPSTIKPYVADNTVFMNPPFSLASKFVEQAIACGARKIVCFQRFAWWESAERREFWKKNPPNRIYICGSRATCWRHDLPPEKRKSSSSTAHAWFVWEKGNPAGTVTGHIYKKGGGNG